MIDILSRKEKRRQKRWRNSAARLMRRRDHLKEIGDNRVEVVMDQISGKLLLPSFRTIK